MPLGEPTTGGYPENRGDWMTSLSACSIARYGDSSKDNNSANSHSVNNINDTTSKDIIRNDYIINTIRDGIAVGNDTFGVTKTAKSMTTEIADIHIHI
jgi:hypothetical protein